MGLYDRSIERGRRVGIVACNAYLVASGQRLPGTYADRHGGADGATLTDLLRSNPIFVSALCPADVLRAAGGFSTECWGSEDHDLWLRIVELGYEVVGTSEPLVEYRVAAGSVSDSAIGMARTTQATYRRALERGRLDAPAAPDRPRRHCAPPAPPRRSSGSPTAGRRGCARRWQPLPAFAAAAFTQPGRWPHWTRLVLARARRT